MTKNDRSPTELPLTRHSRVLVAPGVVFAEVDGDTVLLDSRSGVYYGLNSVGTRLWPLLVEGAPMGDAHATLLAQYDVPADVLWADLTTLILHMQASGLVTVE